MDLLEKRGGGDLGERFHYLGILNEILKLNFISRNSILAIIAVIIPVIASFLTDMLFSHLGNSINLWLNKIEKSVAAAGF